LFPKLVEELELVVDVLPLFENTTSSVFTGFALNIGVQTLPHWDKFDFKQFCMVLSFGDAKGGDLCLVEAGLQFELCPGDVVAFMSGQLTHFNLPFAGCRLTIVCYTERSLEAWLHGNHNAWGFSIN
jgi:hypothetical protein